MQTTFVQRVFEIRAKIIAPGAWKVQKIEEKWGFLTVF
jgi:hypothetical protein